MVRQVKVEKKGIPSMLGRYELVQLTLGHGMLQSNPLNTINMEAETVTDRINGEKTHKLLFPNGFKVRVSSVSFRG
jgi:hypothetical protein